jgi:hypothetical protein
MINPNKKYIKGLVLQEIEAFREYFRLVGTDN